MSSKLTECVFIYGRMLEEMLIDEDADPLEILIKQEELNDPSMADHLLTPVNTQAKCFIKSIKLRRHETMSNMGKVQRLIEETAKITDQYDRDLYTGRIFSSISWHAGIKILSNMQRIESINESMNRIDEQYDNEDARKERMDELSDKIQQQELIINDANNLFAWAVPQSIKQYQSSLPLEIVKLLSTERNITDDMAVDLNRLQKSVDDGRLTQAQADKIIVQAKEDEAEREKLQKEWYEQNRQHLTATLRKTIEAGAAEDFEISDQAFSSLMQKLADKIDTIIGENETKSYARATGRRAKRSIEANAPLLENLLDTADEMVKDVLHVLEGAGYEPKEDGVH